MLGSETLLKEFCTSGFGGGFVWLPASFLEKSYFVHVRESSLFLHPTMLVCPRNPSGNGSGKGASYVGWLHSSCPLHREAPAKAHLSASWWCSSSFPGWFFHKSYSPRELGAAVPGLDMVTTFHTPMLQTPGFWLSFSDTSSAPMLLVLTASWFFSVLCRVCFEPEKPTVYFGLEILESYGDCLTVRVLCRQWWWGVRKCSAAKSQHP